MSAIRICPVCGLEAGRLPSKDTADEIAFQCLTGVDIYKNPHPYFREPRPPVVEAVKSMVVPVTDDIHVTTVTESLEEPIKKHRAKRSENQPEKNND